jgi:hypothetical protein
MKAHRYRLSYDKLAAIERGMFGTARFMAPEVRGVDVYVGDVCMYGVHV